MTLGITYWAGQVALGIVAPSAVPQMDGVNIQWDLGDIRSSITAAKAMAEAFAEDLPW
jgi:hypothetical protein